VVNVLEIAKPALTLVYPVLVKGHCESTRKAISAGLRLHEEQAIRQAVFRQKLTVGEAQLDHREWQ
jgi:hypothetical protein